MPHEPARFVRRRAADALLSRDDGSLERRSITEVEGVTLFNAIDRKKCAQDFGVVKLSRLDVNSLLEPPVHRLEHGGPLANWAPRITLIAYAAHRGNDAVVMALLRAKADPSVRALCRGIHDGTPTETARTDGVVSYVSALPPSYAVFLVCEVIAMRRFGESESSEDSSHLCQVCSEAGTQQPLRWLKCGHLICEPCFWAVHQTHYRTSWTELACQSPGCHDISSDPAHDWVRWAKLCHQIALADEAEEPDLVVSVREVVRTAGGVHARERRAASLHRHDLLPAATLATSDTAPARHGVSPSEGSRKRAVQGRLGASRWEAAGQRLGGSREARGDVLRQAAANGDVVRVARLIDAGVDIDAADECGETAAFQAAWCAGAHCAMGAAVLGVLAWAGADLERPAHGGDTPLRAALAAGHTGAVRVLRALCKPPQDDALLGEVPHLSGVTVSVPHPNVMIPLLDTHPGAGAFTLDGAVRPTVLSHLDHVFASLPLTMPPKPPKTEGGEQDKASGVSSAVEVVMVAKERKNELKARVKQLVRRLGDDRAPEVVEAQQQLLSARRALKAAAAAAATATEVEVGTRVVSEPSSSSSAMAPPLASSLSVARRAALGRGRTFGETAACRCFFVDASGVVTDELEAVLKQCLNTIYAEVHGHSDRDLVRVRVLPRMRFLSYEQPGGAMQPHTDLAKHHPLLDYRRGASTHTFLLHLATCNEGGSTVMLDKVAPVAMTQTIAEARPQRGRLVVFPHVCPHAGLAVDDAHLPKRFLRGEFLIERTATQPPDTQ